jgi:4-diphosphocytidyl-2-C-methyl-D-erythritol kinase
MRIKIKAPAKINLTLEIVKRLPSGYHELRTVILKLDKLFDEIAINFDPEGRGIKIRSNSKAIPLGGKNTCYGVAHKYLEKIGEKIDLEIKIIKNIPSGAGFGGGSSDGASVLLALNKYFKSRLSMKEMIEIAQEVGKDIPVFLTREKAIMVGGMGEKLSPLFGILNLHLLAVNPRIYSSTKKAYEMASKKLWFMENKKKADISREMIGALGKKDREKIALNLYNDFEIVLEKSFPIIKELKLSLLAFGAEGALMSGAGSSVFGLFSSKKEAMEAKIILEKQYPKFFFHAE